MRCCTFVVGAFKISHVITGTPATLSPQDITRINDVNDTPDIDGSCHWRVRADGKCVEWNGVVKFYLFEDWLQWMIDTHLKPLHLTLSGAVDFAGENDRDDGKMWVDDEGKVVKNRSGRDNRVARHVQCLRSMEETFGFRPVPENVVHETELYHALIQEEGEVVGLAVASDALTQSFVDIIQGASVSMNYYNAVKNCRLLLRVWTDTHFRRRDDQGVSIQEGSGEVRVLLGGGV